LVGEASKVYMDNLPNELICEIGLYLLESIHLNTVFTQFETYYFQNIYIKTYLEYDMKVYNIFRRELSEVNVHHEIKIESPLHNF